MFTLFAQIRRALALVPPDRRWRWGIPAVLSIALTALEAIGAALIYLLVSLISSPDATVVIPVIGDLAARFPGRSSRELRAGAAVAVAVFFLFRAAFVLATKFVQSRMVAYASAVMASDLLDGYLELPYLFHTQRSSAELMRNTLNGAQKALTGILIPALNLITRIVLSVTFVVGLIIISPIAMLAATALLGTTVLVIQRFVRPRLTELAQREESATKESIATIQQALGGVRDIKLLQREVAFSGLHRRQQSILARNSYMGDFLTALSPLAIETALMLTIVSVFVLTTAGTGGTQDALPVLAVFAYVGLRLQPVLQEIVSFFNKITRNLPMLDIIERDRRIIDDWRSSLSNESELTPDTEPTRSDRLASIEFRDVSFGYSDGGPLVLEAIDLVIQRGQFIGVCGPTGGGKSTLADLLVGLLQPTSGTILVDGTPLGRRPLWWWAQIGVVSQSVFLTDGTLRNNITFGAGAAEDDGEERLRRCVERAQLLPVVQQLPAGLDTFVGERGVRLSGGQRQRVAIARALYRESEVLVLDEGTSALDGATERALVAAIDAATHERTLIAIAHRIATIRNADRILVVDSGRIVDQGTYDELIDRNGLFQSLA